jgi:hypothetical protein
VTRADSRSDVAHNFRDDWQTLCKEIAIGFILAGFIGLLGNGFFNSLFLKSSPPLVQTIWGAFIGPVIAARTTVPQDII